MKIPQIKTLILALGIIVLVLAGYLTYDHFYNDSNKNSYENFIIRNYEAVSKPQEISVKKIITPQLNTEELKSLVQNTPAFSKLPNDAVIVLSFFDGNGYIRNDLYFTLYGNGEIKNYYDPDYDFKITTGDYYINKIKQSNDLCSALKDIKNTKDYLIDRKISIFSATLKYRSLLQYKSCIY